MKPIRLAPMRLARRLKQFNLSLLATLAALAMTACSADVPVPPPAERRCPRASSKRCMGRARSWPLTERTSRSRRRAE